MADLRSAPGGADIAGIVRRLAVTLAVLAALGMPVVAQPRDLVVSVAASLYDALVEIGALYRSATGVSVAFNTGGSNTLARQIVEGARVGLFLSADDIQMDIVEKAGRLVPGSRVPLLTNQLVVIVPKRPADRASKDPPLRTAADLTRPGVRRVAMGEPSSVPAGVYGRKWLEHQNAWPAVAPKLVPFPTVRAVLAAVETSRADAGIVYRTDAIGRTDVEVPIVVPIDIAPGVRIVMPAAVVSGSAAGEGAKFLAFLKSAKASAVFERRGFGLPAGAVRER